MKIIGAEDCGVKDPGAPEVKEAAFQNPEASPSLGISSSAALPQGPQLEAGGGGQRSWEGVMPLQAELGAANSLWLAGLKAGTLGGGAELHKGASRL